MTDYSKRENCPLEVGDVVVAVHHEERLEYVDWPTDGPQFTALDVVPMDPDAEHEYVQLESDEFAQMWDDNELKLEEDND